jgi:hypothetical protein
MSKQWKNNLESLYQQTRQELPPPELDQKICLAAQKAVQHKSPNLKWYLSTAAVVLLALNVVLFTYVPEPEVIELPGQSPSVPQYKALPKVESFPGNPAPMMEPMLDSIDAERPPQTEISGNREVPENKSYSKKIISSDLLSESSQTKETSQSLELNGVSNPVKQRYSISYPKQLPFDVSRLIAGHPELTGRQSRDSIEISKNNKLILKMSRVQQGIFIEAYPEAKLWGVYSKWGLSNEGLKNCTMEDYIICDLNSEVEGGFGKNGLIFIRWVQKNAP